MTAELLLAPVGAGKTEQALARIEAVLQQKPFARVWVLLATERQIQAFRSRLIEEHIGSPAVFNVEFFTFYELYARTLETAGQPTRQLGEPARLRLLRVLAQRMVEQGTLDVYSGIAHKSGFVRVLADFIYELKQELIEPQVFLAQTQTVFEDREKDAELAALYAAYQERLLAHDIVDREGEGWLALEKLNQNDQLHRDVDLLVIDGYDQFTTLQAEMIALMAKRVKQTLVTLTTVPEREDTVGKRFGQAQGVLAKAHEKHKEPLQTHTLPTQAEQRHPDLQHLAANIFRLERNTTASQGGVQFLAVPDVVTETGAVLRRVKRLLLDGTPPDDVMVVLRDYERYHVHIRNIGRAYRLPLALHLGEPLAQTPPIQALMSLITLHDDHINIADFLCRPVLDALRTPYFQILDSDAVNMLDRISREYAVVGGRQMWLDAIDQAAAPQVAGEEDDTYEKPPLIEVDMQARLQDGLSHFFDAITPPAKATVADYVQWIENLIGQDPVRNPDEESGDAAPGTLNMIASLRRQAPAYVISRDIAALSEFKRVLRTLLEAQELLSTLEDTSDTVTWTEFLADLRASVERASIDNRPPRTGRVLVTTAADARGLPHAHIFVMGLSEGLFPLRVPEDPLYLDNEREKLAKAGLSIRTLAERAADDGVFYELISIAQQTLTLSRPTVKDGAPWIESHLWRETAAVFSDAAARIADDEIRVGQITPAPQAATADEAAVGVAAAFTEPGPARDIAAVYNWLLHHPAWANIHTGRGVEAKRFSADVHDAYSGWIQTPALVDKLKHTILTPQYVWSASRLNDYGACPYRFFVGRVLHLEAIEEPQLGMDARQLGSLNHTILERTYRILADENMEINSDNEGPALKILEQMAREVLADAPQRFGFRQGPLWEQEKDVLMTRLRLLVTHDFTEMNDKLAKDFGARPRFPYQMETDFGIGGYGMLLDTHTDELPPVKIGGYIDRIDRYGDDALVLDYKTGGTTISTDELEIGRNFQIMLYILAAQGILDAKQDNEPNAPRHVLGGYFYHIREPKMSDLLAVDDEEHAVIMERTRALLGRHIQRAQSGDFAVRPVKPAIKKGSWRCTHYCEFYKMCRINVTDLNKPEPRL